MFTLEEAQASWWTEQGDFAIAVCDRFGRSVVCVQEVFADAWREAQALLDADGLLAIGEAAIVGRRDL